MNAPTPPRRTLVALALLLGPAAAAPFTVSGTIDVPASGNGDRAELEGAIVRLEGTGLWAPAVRPDPSAAPFHATFALAGVPAGAVTLLLEEPPGQDAFSHASRRLPLLVAADTADVAFALRPHWAQLPGYPPPWHDGNYDVWQPYFVSARVGFLLFAGRWLPSPVHELWRTVDGGASWGRIGLWNPATDWSVPDQYGDQSLFFADADHGLVTGRAGGPGFVSVGLLRTADGGATWTHVDLPNTPAVGELPAANGLVAVTRMAALDDRRWIACGVENVGSSMGSGTPGYVTVWETADAGATWTIATGWREDYGACSALAATPDGRAILFDTPYPFGGTRRLALRDPSGAWTVRAGQPLVTNSGYGSADVPMVGATAWVAGDEFDASGAFLGSGIWRSADCGATWAKLTDARPLYFSFATPLRGLALGGRAMSTYDGGLTWLHQAAGGGSCCHGNRVWAFDRTSAIWQDGGPGDPNGVADLLTYVEPAVPDLEVRAGAALPDVDLPARAAATRVPALAIALESHGPVALRLRRLTVRAAGTGDDRAEIAALRLWLDGDGDGQVGGAADRELASATFETDDGAALLPVADAPLLEEAFPLRLLVTHDLVAIRHLRTFTASVASAEVEVETSGEGEVVQVAATAPAGTTWRGPTLTVQARADLRVEQVVDGAPGQVGRDLTWRVRIRNDGPDDAAAVRLVDTLPAGVAFSSATSAAGGCTHAAGTVTCALGELASGAAAEVLLAVRPSAAGVIVNQARASALEPDPHGADDASSLETPVAASPGGGGGGCGCATGEGNGLAALSVLVLVAPLGRRRAGWRTLTADHRTAVR